VDQRDTPQYSATGCNTQGLQPQDFAQPAIASRMCAAAARSTGEINTAAGTCGKAVSGECVPNMVQFNEISNPLTFTPCLVDQSYEDFLQITTKTPFDSRGGWPGVSHILPDYNPLMPKFWLHGAKLLSSAAGQTTIESRIILYVKGRFVAEVTSVSTGEFVNASMLCNAVQGGPGAVSAVIHNTGGLTGLYFVSVQIYVGPKGNASGIDYATPVSEVPCGNKICKVIATRKEVAAGGYGQVQFDYRYTGPAVNELYSTVTLWVLAQDNGASESGYQPVDSMNTSCTITIGKTLASRNLSLGAILTQNQAYTCEWWDVRYWVCVGHYRQLWMLPVNLLLYVPLMLCTVVLLFTAPVAIVRLSAQRRAQERKIARQAQQTAEAIKEQQEQLQQETQPLLS
jgi:hypothetical protein